MEAENLTPYLEPFGAEAITVFVPTEGDIPFRGVTINLDPKRLVQDFHEQISKRGLALDEAFETIFFSLSAQDMETWVINNRVATPNKPYWAMGNTLLDKGTPRFMHFETDYIVQSATKGFKNEETLLREINLVLNIMWVHEREHLIQMLSQGNAQSLVKQVQELTVNRAATAFAWASFFLAMYYMSNLKNEPQPQTLTPLYIILAITALYVIDGAYRWYHNRYLDEFENEARRAAEDLDVLPNIFEVIPEY